MKIALLILAHSAPSVLKAACSIYHEADFAIFCHLDKKANQDAYRSELGDWSDVVFFSETRQEIFWGGFSMVAAQIELLNTARSHNTYDRYVLVSDDTFPLLPSLQLRVLVENNKNRIATRLLSDGDPLLSRYKEFFCYDHAATALRGRTIETGIMDEQFVAAIAEMGELQRQGKKSLDIYYGSQWWILTAKLAHGILEEYNRDKHLRQSFRFSAVPDEIMFQTIARRIAPIEDLMHAPVLVDWSRMPKPFVFTEVSDIFSKAQPYHAFVRKIPSKAGSFVEELKRAVLQRELGQINSSS